MTITGSVLGFFLGLLAYHLVLHFALGGLVYNGLKAAFERIPEARAATVDMARQTCLAHAAILDDLGYTHGAGMLMQRAQNVAPADPDTHLFLHGTRKNQLLKRYARYLLNGNVCLDCIGEMQLDCETHGPSVWQGHMSCLRCQRVYAAPDAPENPAPTTCSCGYRLLPHEDPRLPFSARAQCRHCYGDDLLVTIAATVFDPSQEQPLDVLPDLLSWGFCEECGSEAFVRLGDGADFSTFAFQPDECPVCQYSHPSVQEDHVTQ